MSELLSEKLSQSSRARPEFKFISKAETLHQLQAWPEFNIPEVFFFTVDDWNKDRGKVLKEIRTRFPDSNLAVRSSSLREDSCENSGAGAFCSVLNVESSRMDKLVKAICSVIDSYGEHSFADQVLIQPMISEPGVTGVIMTRSITDGAPYYVINYDDESGKTDTITSGSSISKTVHVYRGVKDGDFDSSRLKSFVHLARRLEEICGNDSLDIEFCLDNRNVLHLLQVRPICARSSWSMDHTHLEPLINNISAFICEQNQSELFGNRTILGVMPDWNPAEMIGILPGSLASSLYRNLITSRVWSLAREKIGYHPVPAKELMKLVLGRPYIDVRASFNSFLPAGLDPVTSEALVSAWLDRLEANPHLHDKVEFEIAQTVLDFSFDRHMEERYPDLLSTERKRDFRQKLLFLTQNCLDDSREGTLRMALDAISELRNRQAARQLFYVHNAPDILNVPSLLEECREYGTLPFSILARHAFIAESLLRTAVEREAISAERIRDFKLSFRTIAGEIAESFMEVSNGEMDPENFIRKYGHLRPGTYDILSPRYADRENLFGNANIGREGHVKLPDFRPTATESAALCKIIRECGLNFEPEFLFNYAKTAIAGRELAKFVFSRNLSDVLEIIASWGNMLGFDREETAHIDIDAITNQFWRLVPDEKKEFFSSHIEANRQKLQKSRSLKLGYLIRSPRDVFIAPQHRSAPNFIGADIVNAPLIELSSHSGCEEDISGKIVLIENADPGFDWIFTRNIVGLVTKFGGANSHMAIRCAEYGLPAAIGVGEQNFYALLNSSSAVLNPADAILKGI